MGLKSESKRKERMQKVLAGGLQRKTRTRKNDESVGVRAGGKQRKGRD